MLVDSHCHLDFPDYEDSLPDVLNRAKEAGVGVMQTISTKLSTWDKVIKVAEEYENVYASIGIHPHEVENEKKITAAEIVKLAEHPKVIGIGETGLDYYYEHSPRELQQESFRQHIAAARESGLPLIVHSREADEDTVNILTQQMAKGKFKGLIHCFSSSKHLAEKSIEIGLYISISGIITFNKAEELREAVKTLPLTSLLVETDAPFLAPVPKRGKTNEPAFTRYTAEYLADLLGVGFDEVERVTTDNFFALFNKAKR